MNTKQIKNVFTLVELLAVIVILGIIMAIGGGITMQVKKNANEEQAKQLEKTIKELGPNIYSHESLVGVKDYKSYCDDIGGDYNGSTCTSRDGATKNDESDNYFYKSYKKLDPGESIQVSLKSLKEAGYLKSETILSPSGNGNCNGYLEIKKINFEPVFKGYISCAGLDPTTDYNYDEEKEVKLTKIE